VLVPITQGKTLFVDRKPGAKVNLEVDVLAKYVARSARSSRRRWRLAAEPRAARRRSHAPEAAPNAGLA
jgi:riboflavin synthase alpha subunit